MATSDVETEEELRTMIKAPPSSLTAKIRSGPLAASPSQFLSHARLGIVSVVNSDGSRRMFAVGGEAGFVTQDQADGRLIVPLSARRRQELATQGADVQFAGLLVMVPGVRHTLRINGTAVLSHDGEALVLTPAQSYAHCAKAFIRSDLWNASVATAAPAVSKDASALEFIASSPFAAIGTSLVGSDADVSPRGDPPGFVQVPDSNRLFIPERPGNRIADSLRNIIANPVASVLFMVPGDPRVLEVAGQASITVDTDLCAAAEVNGKVPKLGVLITIEDVGLSYEPALDASDAWNPAFHASEADLPTIGALVADPQDDGSTIKRALTGITDRVVRRDYKRNLY